MMMMMGVARVAGLLGLATSALAATVQVDLQPCILAPSSIVSALLLNSVLPLPAVVCVPANSFFRDEMFVLP